MISARAGGGQAPALADFNGDGLLDIFITRQAPMSNGNVREGFTPIGCSLFLSDGRLDRFRDVSVEYGRSMNWPTTGR